MKLEDLRKNLEHWFDDAMDRVSGWYKRRAQVVTLVVGLVVCVCFNVDAVAIFSTLWKDPTVRESVVQQAARFNANAEKPESLSVEDLSKQLQTLALPIGWTVDANGGISFERFRAESIIGWIIGALAVSMGSQFWFDMLSKLLNLRSAGAKPPTAAELRS